LVVDYVDLLLVTVVTVTLLVVVYTCWFGWFTVGLVVVATLVGWFDLLVRLVWLVRWWLVGWLVVGWLLRLLRFVDWLLTVVGYGSVGLVAGLDVAPLRVVGWFVGCWLLIRLVGWLVDYVVLGCG